MCRRCGVRYDSELAWCPACGELDRALPCPEHPDTVARRACVVCGRPVCDACRKGSRHSSLCPRHAHLHVISGWAEVLRTASVLEAEMAAGILRGARLEAHVLSQKDSANVVSFGGLSVIRVLVPAYRHAEAMSVLRTEGFEAIG